MPKANPDPMTPSEYLAAILRGVLPWPDAFSVDEARAGEVTVLTIHVPPESRRFVVGKEGRNIKAVRILLQAYSGSHARTVILKLNDEEEESHDHARSGMRCLPQEGKVDLPRARPVEEAGRLARPAHAREATTRV